MPQGEEDASWNHQVWNLNSPAELNMPWQCQWTWKKNDKLLLYAQVSESHAVSYCKYCTIQLKSMFYIYPHFVNNIHLLQCYRCVQKMYNNL